MHVHWRTAGMTGKGDGGNLTLNMMMHGNQKVETTQMSVNRLTGYTKRALSRQQNTLLSHENEGSSDTR